jgi:hypothetical protein
LADALGMGLWLLMTAPTSATGGLVASAATMEGITMGDTISSAMVSVLDISAVAIPSADSMAADFTVAATVVVVVDIDRLI